MQQKERLNRTRTLVRREDGKTEVEENGLRIEAPDLVYQSEALFRLELQCFQLQLPSSFPGFVVDTEPDLQVAEVIPGTVFLGSQDVAADLQLLRSRQITHILNMAPSAVDNFFPTKFEYAKVDLLDTPDAALPIDEILRFLSKEKDGAKILVHCNAGISR